MSAFIFEGNSDYRSKGVERAPAFDWEINGVQCCGFRFRGCKILVSREFGKWHLSISHPEKYPDWDTIRDARYALLPDDITMAMLLPPTSQYVNVHHNCFHLHEIENEE